MPTVPTYLENSQRVDLRPNYRQEITTQASADDFGAGIGRGITQAAQGLDQASQAVAAVTEMTNEAHATDAANKWVRQKNELLYNPEGGYANADGKTAVDGYDPYRKAIEKLTEETSAELTPGARAAFAKKIDGYEADALAQGMRISSAGTKQYIIGQHTAAAATASEQAIQTPTDENRFRNFIGQGISEMKASAAKQGWSPEQTSKAVMDYVSSARKSAALQLSLSDPLAALKYATDNAGELTGQDRADLISRLKTEAGKAAAQDMIGHSAANVKPNEFAAQGFTRDQYAMLSVISGGEAHGYNIMNGGARFADFARHPGMIGLGGTSTAAGRYQFIKDTWATAAKALGLTDFSPASQDRAAMWLAQRDYHTNTGRDLMSDVAAGNYAQIRRGLGSTWESFAKESDESFAKRMNAARSGPVRAGVVTIGAGTVDSPYSAAPADPAVTSQTPALGGSSLLAGVSGGSAPASSSTPTIGTGSPAPLASAGAVDPNGPRLSEQTEAILAGLPAAYADDIRAAATASFRTFQREQQAGQKAIQAGQVGTYELRIANGEDVTTTEINHDTVLDDGQKAALIMRLNTRDKSAVATSAGLDAFHDGKFSVDPYTEQGRKLNDAVWTAAVKNAAPDQQLPLLLNLVNQSGAVPTGVVNGMRKQIATGNALNTAQALDIATKIAAVDPAALARETGGQDIMDDAALYQHYTQDMGYSPAVAAGRILDMKDPAKKKASSILLGSETDKASNAYKILGDATADNVASMFKTGHFWNSAPTLGSGSNQSATLPAGAKTADGTPSVGSGPLQAAAITQDYKEMLTDALVSTNGDYAAAKSMAEARMKAIYSTSKYALSGNNSVVWLPPEKTYPADAHGSWDYIGEQAKAALKEQGITASDIYLHPDKDTMREHGTKDARPAYQLYYKDSSGQYQRFQYRFRADPPTHEEIAAVQAADKSKEIAAAAETQQENAKLQELSQDRDANLDQFLDGPVQMPAAPAKPFKESGRAHQGNAGKSSRAKAGFAIKKKD